MDFIEGLAGDWATSFHAGALGIDIMPGDPGDGGVAKTVGLMNGHANKAIGSVQIQDALRIAGITQGMGEDEIIQRVFKFIKGKVKFVEDDEQLARVFELNHPNGRELLISPPVLLSMSKPMGDCDDFSMLACSMLNASGVKCDFVTVAADERNPETFTHVYCMVTKQNGEQVPFDASHSNRVGWETWKQWRKQIWPFIPWGDSKRGEGMSGFTQDQIDATWLNEGIDISGAGGTNWGSVFANVIPGIFSAGEKIAVQTTQKAGYQTIGPNGQMTSYVLPAGSSASGFLNIPGSSGGSIGSSGLLLGIGALALLFFLKK